MQKKIHVVLRKGWKIPWNVYWKKTSKIVQNTLTFKLDKYAQILSGIWTIVNWKKNISTFTNNRTQNSTDVQKKILTKSIKYIKNIASKNW